jgi:hypothetical protein
MKKVLKYIGIILAILIVGVAFLFFSYNESLPNGVEGKEADNLASKMLNTLNFEAYKETEVLEWSFRGEHFYKWNKNENTVIVSWSKNKVKLNTKNTENSIIIESDKDANSDDLIQLATDYFNNDSFWLVAPYKVFDQGVERKLVKHNDKDALLITYTSGGSTPGDSYLWILDKNGLPTSYKMWVSIIPIGGLEATWSNWKTTASGIKLPTKHALNIINKELDMGEVKAYNPKADALAIAMLETIRHEAYKKTRFIEWSFGGRRSYKWDKKEHIVEVNWGLNKVILHPNNLEKSVLFVDGTESTENKNKLVKKAESSFNNDSFWLVAPHKLFETGIIRSVVQYKGSDALKVKYTTGGSTPGDSYIWVLNEHHLPIKYLMNVPSMKMNEVPATWEDWFVTESETMLPKSHTFSGGRKLSMGDVKAYNK